MDITYTMIGTDGLQYGPVQLAQIKTWIAERRITADTKILRSDTNSWLNAYQYQELGLAPAPVPIAGSPIRPSIQPQGKTVDGFLLRRVRSTANWFFFIAGFSIVNTILMNTHQG